MGETFVSSSSNAVKGLLFGASLVSSTALSAGCFMICSNSYIIFAWSFSALFFLFLFLFFLGPITIYSENSVGFIEAEGSVIKWMLLLSSGFTFDSFWVSHNDSSSLRANLSMALSSYRRNFCSSLMTLWRQLYFSSSALLSKSCAFRSSYWHSK